MGAIINKIVLTVFIVFNLTFNMSAQVFELNELKQAPSVNEKNMNTIAMSIWFLFEEAMKNPIKYSNPAATAQTVFEYRETAFNSRCEKLSEAKGRLYTLCYQNELDLNNRLLFNLKFDSTGRLIVPGTIYVIFNRQELTEGNLIVKGSWAFELIVTDSIKATLLKVQLESPALSAISKGGEFHAVEVNIPFNITHLEGSLNFNSVLEIKKKNFNLFTEEKGAIYKNDTNMIKAILEFMEYKLLQYDQGRFKFEITRYVEGLQIDLNIRRHKVWTSQQTKNFPVYTYRVSNYEGQGEKSRRYLKIQKNVELKLGHQVKG
ncbi:MAG: hypothetical protein Q8M15_04730 [Bacteroidota bacterium]|nr:hypothetical protein [Bacteroidota bacterium]